MVQCWRSTKQPLAYATDRDAAHLPAWKAFDRAVGTDGSVGIWHETDRATAGSYEYIYVNMPPFGLARAGSMRVVGRGTQSAAERFAAREPTDVDPG